MVTEAVGSLATALSVSWRSASLWRRLQSRSSYQGSRDVIEPRCPTLVLVVSPAKNRPRCGSRGYLVPMALPMWLCGVMRG